MSVEEALDRFVQSGARVFIQTGCGAPQHLISNLGPVLHDQLQRRDIEILSLHVNGRASYLDRKYESTFRVSSFFFGPNERRALKQGHRGVAYVPMFLSEISNLFRENRIVDVALVQVSPPDRHGFCSMGVSVDISLNAMLSAKYVIAQVNPRCPRTHGDSFIHVRHLDALVMSDTELPTIEIPAPTEDEMRIAHHVASVVKDGSCIQLGIGSIPNAVAMALCSHKDLGVHTEMFSDGILRLFRQGCITNRHKRVHPGAILTSFVMGSQELYDFVDDNPAVVFRDSGFVNNVGHIMKNKNTVAINSAIEIDLTGQICADSIGVSQYSGVGGQLDFMMGSARSEGGRSVIAIKSVVQPKGGDQTEQPPVSKIVPMLNQGSGVVTTRAHVQYVATEYGVVDLYGKTLPQRARLLISIAHPAVRSYLESEARKRFPDLDRLV